MKKSYCHSLILLLGMNFYSCFQPNFISTFKGVGHDVGDVFKKIGSKSFWDGVGRGFGASPTGYVYSFTVQNDTQQEAYAAIQEFASAMGATFPKAGGWSSHPVEPFGNYSVHSKEYYFEMTINDSDKEPSNHLPYVNSSALYVQDCIQLPKEKHSTKMNYFRTYIGKSLQDGQYVHGLRAEYLGYADPTNPGDKSASVSFSSDIDSLVLHNSTDQDFDIGYSSQNDLSKLSKKDCDVFFALVENHSFALFSPSESNPLHPGTVGLFKKGSEDSVAVFSFPKKIFKGKKYTLEIYQDPGESVQMGLQGVMPGHYDVATGKIRDITTITAVFWYQSVLQAYRGSKTMSSYVDLPGAVWVVFAGGDVAIQEQVPLSQSLEMRFLRPLPDTRQLIYFIYVDTQNEQKSQLFVEHFVQGIIGKEVLQAYQTQSQHQIALAQKGLTQTLDISKQTATEQVPQELLIEAVQGALKVHKGKIEDSSLGLTGYLLGADVFLPQGVSVEAPFYYTLAPSMKTAHNVPMSAVQNEYTYTLGAGKPPKGIPAPSKLVGIPKRVLPKKVKPKAKDPDEGKSKKEILKSKISNFFGGVKQKLSKTKGAKTAPHANLTL